MREAQRHLSLHRNGFVCQSCWRPLGLGCLRAHVNHHGKVASITPIDGFCFHRKTDLLNTLVNVTAVNHPERGPRVQIKAHTRNPFLRGLEVCLNLDGKLGFDTTLDCARRLKCDDPNAVARRHAWPVASFIVREHYASAKCTQKDERDDFSTSYHNDSPLYLQKTHRSRRPIIKRPATAATTLRANTLKVVAFSVPDLLSHKFPSLTGQLQDMHPAVGAVYDINQPTIINLDVVGLDPEVADLHGGLTRSDRDIRAPDVGIGRRRGNIMRYLLGAERIPDVDRPLPCVEPGDEGKFPVVNVGEIFAAGMGAEATAAVAEVTAVLTDLVIGDDRRFGLVPGGPGRDVYKVNELAVPGAYTRTAAAAGLIDENNKVPRRILCLRRQRWHRLSKQRKGGMRAHGRRGVQSAELRAEKVRLRGVSPEICRRWTSVSGWVQQLLPINDLENAIRPGPMTEV